MIKYIDLENWKRKEHFNFFYRMDHPQVNICMNLDITKFLKFVKEKKLSFYCSMIYAVTGIVNTMDDFKYRIRDGKVVLHDIIHPSFTYLDKGSEDDLYKLITVDFKDNLFEFERTAKKSAQNQKDFIRLDKLTGRDDLIYITCNPWISFTSLSHTISINKNDSVPRISWGKYYNDGNKTLMPFSVQFHHSLMDGIHIGRYVEQLQRYMDEIK